MGKSRDTGRSKSRPSSSSLAASLLPTGVSNVGFGGYVGSSRIEASTSGEEGPPPAVVDGEVAQHLNRLGRKDPVTKLKALTALSTLFKQKSEDDIVQIIPQWAFEYKRLLNDYNREVRRATHETMSNLVTTVRRGLAPHLKSLMGPWWFSQFDEAPEISQAARRSFEVAFPAQEKRLDALSIYSNEILLYLDENLRLTPQAMSDKAMPADELEDMYQRVIFLSLLAIATLVEILVGVKSRGQKSDISLTESKVVSKARMAAISSAEKMFISHKYFLEFMRSKNPQVRSSSYTILKCFVKHVPQVFNEENLKVLSAAIMGALQEKDSLCHSSMWDMVLLFGQTFPNCWTYGNVLKNVLNWSCNHFINGCYGSQKISYPVLVPFLDLLPSKTIFGDHFIITFLDALWAGRNPLHSQSDDRLVFFKAFKECFLWGLFNGSRHFVEDDVHLFQIKFVEYILVKLLWRDYISLHKNCKEAQSKVTDSKDDFTGCADVVGVVMYPKGYVDDLGRCIVEILSNIFMNDQALLNPYCTVFQKDCMEAFQRNVGSEGFSEQIDLIANFFLLLDQVCIATDQTWPLHYLAGPLIANSFALIKSTDSPNAVRVLIIIAKIFGPRAFVLNLISSTKELYGAKDIEGFRDELNTKYFLQIFNDYVIPWCIRGCSPSLDSRLDLLACLLDDDVTNEQWDLIIVYATSPNNYLSDDGIGLNADCACILAMLLEKVRDMIKRKVMCAELNKGVSFEAKAKQWKHQLLDSFAISVVHHPFSNNISHAHFLSAAVGNTAEDHACFLSKETVIHIFGAIFKNLIHVLSMSPHDWVKEAYSLLSNGNQNADIKNLPSIVQYIDAASFSLDVLSDSFFCLNELDKDNKLVASTLAAVLTIAWESSMISPHFVCDSLDWLDSMLNSVLEPKSDGENNLELASDRLSLGTKACTFLSKMSREHWRGLNLSTLQILGDVLLHIVRLAIFDLQTVSNANMPTLCCSWILYAFDFVSPNHTDEQKMLDQLFSENKYWPVWVAADFDGGKRSVVLSNRSSVDERRHLQFVAFVEKVINNLGVDRVLLGFDSKSSTVLPSFSYSRPWLVAEILCTWRWGGGSVLDSFLPFLFRSSRNFTRFEEGNLVFSLVSVLLDGAIIQGSSYTVSFLNMWTISEDEMECMHDPFLRALVATLWTLVVKDNMWSMDDIVKFFKYLVSKLFIGSSIDRSCLRVLPFLLNVISNKLLEGNSSESENWVKDNILDWLRITLSLAPMALDPADREDVEGWIQVIASLYLLSTTGFGSFKVSATANISHSEKMLIMNIFQKQRLNCDSFNTIGRPVVESSNLICSSMSIQLSLSRLMAVAVGYCRQELNKDDWDFVLSSLHKWIGSLVPMIEEITEKIDMAVNSSTVMEDMSWLEVAIQDVEHSQMELAMSALVIFSLFLDVFDSKQSSNEFPHSILDEGVSQKDRILEDVLRLFFCTGAAEAGAKCLNEKASMTVAESRFAYRKFWELVASCVIFSAGPVRKMAVQSMELWGLGVGAASSLFALLFSLKPMPSLQYAAYHVLSKEPLCFISLFKKSNLIEYINNDQDLSMLFDNNTSLDEPIYLRDDISLMIENPCPQLLEMDLLSNERVNFFLVWALLICHLQSLPSSLAREKLIQFIQDSTSSIVLDCVFQYIPLKAGFMQNLRKKDYELPIPLSKAANAAKHAICTCSLNFAVESLWPIGMEQMASLAGSIYGLMICFLPAYVRNWFSGLRDRTLSTAIESFTKCWCSPSLIADEFSQLKVLLVADENFSVSVNKSAFEIVATYKKEETGMDLVIHLPSCYPLRPVDVDCTRSLGISEVKQRKWLLSLTAFVRNQNGAIAEAIKTWKSNLDKEFLGVEECPICYSIIHTTNHSLPQLACKTCKHKFHSACLYKWFSTSHKSLCPLCQMPF